MPSVSTKNTTVWLSLVPVAVLAATWLYSSSRQRHNRVYPPGPKREFLIGNLRNFPKDNWYAAFSSWQKQYGDLVYINIAGVPMLVVNSLHAAKDLMEKRGSIYSGRPFSMMVCKLMDFGWSLVFLQPGPGFTNIRKCFRQSVGQHVVSAYDQLIEDGAQSLLSSLQDFEGDPYDLIMKSVGSIVIRLAYGDKIYADYGDELTRINQETVVLANDLFSKFWAVDVIKWLQHLPSWLPGMNFKRITQDGAKTVRRARDWPFKVLTTEYLNGTANECMGTKLFDQQGINLNVRDAIGVAFASGTDTSSTTLSILLYAVFRSPQVQEKIHAELDAAIGSNGVRRSGGLDFGDLPYLEAVWKEAMRWNPAVPLGIPHIATKEDTWGGYYIAKGTMVHCNLGFMLRDPRIWGPDADVFKPERFLLECNPTADELPNPEEIAFGFGRRVCAGQHIARRMVCNLAAAILSEFEMSPVKGDEGVSEEPKFYDATTRRPSNFRCSFQKRKC